MNDRAPRAKHPRIVGISLFERINRFIDTSTDCWLWTGATAEGGYGSVRADGRTRAAHRVTYEMWNGPIPDGLHLDHLCRIRRCVNPCHLEAVTCRENVLRGFSACSDNAKKTHCKNGHEFTPENTYLSVTGRECRACLRRLKGKWALRNPRVAYQRAYGLARRKREREKRQETK